MTQKPVQAAQKPSTLPFPLNIRLLQAGWKLLFLHEGVYQPDPTKTAEWNRGAYLAEGLGHCGACHTPRNALGAERSGNAYGGATIDGWIAPALTAANPSPAPWTQDELFAYLRSGASVLHGTAAGSMSEVVHDGLARLPDPDIRAIAAYFADIDQASARAADTETAIAKAAAASARNIAQLSDPDAHLYITACASCHYSGAAMPLAVRPDLSLNSALSLDEPTNFVKVVLSGISLKDGMPGVMMPGFAHSFSDAEIARLAAYLRATRTELPAWTDLETKVAAIRQETPAP
jgi:mono/diheme cytochrome c family protein